MILILAAPYPGILTTCVLPDPALNDPISSQSEIVKHISTGGRIRTFVKIRSRRKMSMTFTLSPLKLAELRALLLAYDEKEFYLEMDFRTHVKWRGYLQNNPFQSTHSTRSMESVSLEFEVIKIT